MSTAAITTPTRLNFESAGIRMTPEEFDAVDEFDGQFRYELINGVVVVSPIPSDAQADPNDLLGYLLHNYRFNHPNGSVLSKTSPERFVQVDGGRRIADRLIWVGFEQRPVSRFDTPTIAVEFVSAGKRSHDRDYDAKCREYLDAGVQEYWVFDRFTRTMTVFRRSESGVETIVREYTDTYQTDRLPGFVLPIRSILDEADASAEAESQRKSEELDP